MKRIFNILFFITTNLMAQAFNISDPPMIYIYHFVSYDTTAVLLHGGQQDESKNAIVQFPKYNSNDMFSKENFAVGKALDPKLVSAMVTSAVAKNPHLNIAGESIQNRIKTDNFIKLVKSYEYPKRTDFIFIGEINTLASQYEIDLKLIDVSTQKIISSESFALDFESINNLRTQINAIVGPLMEKIITPFVGSLFVRVDSTSRDRIRWDDISIRPLRTVVGSTFENTKKSDYAPFKTVNMPPKYYDTHNEILSKYSNEDYKMVSDYNENMTFLEGDYKIQVFLKNNEKYFETNFKVKAGDLNEVHLALSYIPPLKDSDGDGIFDDVDACPDVPGIENKDPDLNGCEPPKLFGNISIMNIWNGVGFELFKMDSDSLILIGNKTNNTLSVESGSFDYLINQGNKSVTIVDLPLGRYLRNSYANTEERFPGKHYVNLFADTDTLIIDEGGQSVKSFIADQDLIKGREVVIYFDPFTPGKDEKYRLFVDNTLFAVTQVVGELHIVGMPANYEGNIIVKRDGFIDALIEIESKNQKSYHLADLTVAQ